jgi:hypothetical protein
MSYDYEDLYDDGPYNNEDEDFDPESEEGFDEEDFDPESDDFDPDFQDPGGRSALRRETPDNPRVLPCPDCGKPNRLTPKDRACGYCCNECADRNEGGGY